MPNQSIQDPRWTEISASLRNGTLYLKISWEKAILLVAVLVEENEDLLLKEVLESPKILIFSDSVDNWTEDLETLKGIQNPGLVLLEFITAIEAGLRNEPNVDWLTRIGGPRRDPLGGLQALETVEIPEGEGANGSLGEIRNLTPEDLL